eukprot:m.141701 g.141701  ORF g.141701 m.141701 type:complete len:348 (+) comp52604_c0_seq1:153-1196(+)
MSKIKALSAATASIISSGQVIVSIKSAVKELIENALDASATTIDVRLDGAGVDRIVVADNGCGISPADAASMAVHACTSKINSFEDLEELETYGFRGEALHSLCSVSNVSISTASHSDSLRTEYQLGQRGEILSERKSAANGAGTTVTVRDIFSAIPVRRKAYDKPDVRKAEVLAIQELLYTYALIHPTVRFSLKNSPQPIVSWIKQKTSTTRETLGVIFGADLASSLTSISTSDGDVTLTAWLPLPSANPRLVTRAANDRTYVFVNKRPILSKNLLKCFRTLPGTARSGWQHLMLLFVGLPFDIPSSCCYPRYHGGSLNCSFSDETPISFRRVGVWHASQLLRCQC